MAKKRETDQTARRYVPRQTRKFQLRRDHPADAHVAEILDFARTERREVTVIREGVALWWALENGNLEYLFEKFPQYRAQFQPDTDDLIEQFRQMLQQQANLRGQRPPAAPNPSPPGRSVVPGLTTMTTRTPSSFARIPAPMPASIFLIRCGSYRGNRVKNRRQY
jgi:hypothetical protein